MKCVLLLELQKHKLAFVKEHLLDESVHLDHFDVVDNVQILFNLSHALVQELFFLRYFRSMLEFALI